MGARVALAAHHDQHERALRCTLTQKRTLHLHLQVARCAAHHEGEGAPALAVLPELLGG